MNQNLAYGSPACARAAAELPLARGRQSTPPQGPPTSPSRPSRALLLPQPTTAVPPAAFTSAAAAAPGGGGSVLMGRAGGAQRAPQPTRACSGSRRPAHAPCAAPAPPCRPPLLTKEEEEEEEEKEKEKKERKSLFPGLFIFFSPLDFFSCFCFAAPGGGSSCARAGTRGPPSVACIRPPAPHSARHTLPRAPSLGITLPALRRARRGR